ncbi:mediator of RNA polymerase II transcription subunit 11 isoform X1 [Pimephales promelas]|uniref:mediator of RNA polymerase II transcription subunit 11 isoform X1 n=2 Tax=Pimephales promelas TaxID=90988 RepID=UPI001955EFB9|nr:mediator of RNA polymerase II transcription subunit 11 isoform X1 [Pimephales promelas]
MCNYSVFNTEYSLKQYTTNFCGRFSPGCVLGMANDRLRALEDVEKEIALVLQSAGTIVLELSKEKANASLLDRQLNQFQTSINRVENELSAQIRYLTQVATGQPHEGSTYSARKDCQMALNRAEYARVKLGELGRTCEIMLEPQT